MSTSSASDQLVQSSLRRNASLIASGVAGASTLALLAAGSALALFAGADHAPAVVWLGGLGTNALASWLDQWARASLSRAIGAEPDAEQQLLRQLARDLQEQLAHSSAMATDVAILLERTQAIPIALEALHDSKAAQLSLLRHLAGELQQEAHHNERLHAVTLRAVQVQGEALRDVIARSDATLLAEIRLLRSGDTVQGDKIMGDKVGGDKVQGDKVTTGGISIGGSVGTLQNVTVTGGTVSGSIIGSQTNCYGAPPPSSSTGPSAASQEDIDEQQELLEAHRRTLAVYLKQHAKLGSAYAPPGVINGIREARAGIRHVKATLRGWGVVIVNHPDDEG